MFNFILSLPQQTDTYFSSMWALFSSQLPESFVKQPEFIAKPVIAGIQHVEPVDSLMINVLLVQSIGGEDNSSADMRQFMLELINRVVAGDGFTPEEAAVYSKGKTWKELDITIWEKGFWKQQKKHYYSFIFSNLFRKFIPDFSWIYCYPWKAVQIIDVWFCCFCFI